jgi:hypothetical protein
MSEGVQQIALASMKVFGLAGELNLLLGRDRHKSIAAARHVAMWVTRKRYAMSFPDIGAVFGGRDHTSAMSACRRVEKNIRDGKPFGLVALRLLQSLPSFGAELALPTPQPAPEVAVQYGGVVIGGVAAQLGSNGARSLEEPPLALELDWGSEGPPHVRQALPGGPTAEPGGARSDAPKEPL